MVVLSLPSCVCTRISNTQTYFGTPFPLAGCVFLCSQLRNLDRAVTEIVRSQPGAIRGSRPLISSHLDISGSTDHEDIRSASSAVDFREGRRLWRRPDQNRQHGDYLEDANGDGLNGDGAILRGAMRHFRMYVVRADHSRNVFACSEMLEALFGDASIPVVATPIHNPFLFYERSERRSMLKTTYTP